MQHSCFITAAEARAQSNPIFSKVMEELTSDLMDYVARGRHTEPDFRLLHIASPGLDDYPGDDAYAAVAAMVSAELIRAGWELVRYETVVAQDEDGDPTIEHSWYIKMPA